MKSLSVTIFISAYGTEPFSNLLNRGSAGIPAALICGQHGRNDFVASKDAPLWHSSLPHMCSPKMVCR